MKARNLENRLATLEAKAPKRDISAELEPLFRFFDSAVCSRPEFKDPPVKYDPAYTLCNSVIWDRNQVSGYELRHAWCTRVAMREGTPDDMRIFSEVAAAWPGFGCMTLMDCMEIMAGIVRVPAVPKPGDMPLDELERELTRHGIEYTLVRFGADIA